MFLCYHCLTHWGRVTHICVSRLTITGSDNGHYLNQCWNIVNWTLRNKLQWNFKRKSFIFIQENALENVICEMASILSRPQCVKWFDFDSFKFSGIIHHWNVLIWIQNISNNAHRPFAQIPQCTSPISHKAPFCDRNVYICAHFYYKMVHCGIFVWCIVGFVRCSISRNVLPKHIKTP